MPRTPSTPSRSRRALVAVALVAASVAGTVGLGGPSASPAGAGAPSFCDANQTKAFICRLYLYNLLRNITEPELGYWEPQLPGRKTVMIASVLRSAESRRRIIEQYYDHFAGRDAGDAEKAYWEGEVLKPNGFRRLEAGLLSEADYTPEEFVVWAFPVLLGRNTGGAEYEYWVDHAEAKGLNLTAAAIAYTPEVRRLRARLTIFNHYESQPDEASIAYWAERLRTGTSYLDMRIALWAASYPSISSVCATLHPPAESPCEP